MTDRNPDETTTSPPTATDTGTRPAGELPVRAEPDGSGSEEAVVPRQLGASRYVLAAFFAGGIAVAFLVSRMLNSAWDRLADNPWLSQRVHALSRIAPDDRPTYTMIAGAIAGIWITIWAYRREDVRTWTNDVAAELAKVTWPSKKEVTNSTVVVILTSAFATVFLALLDRFWSFVTNLVYGS